MSEYSPSGERLWLSPTIQVGEYEFTYLNTVIRLFGDDWAHLNHVEFTDSNGQMCGITVTEDFMDTLMEHGFSYGFDEFPDPITQEWHIKKEMRQLEEDLEELQNHE